MPLVLPLHVGHGGALQTNLAVTSAALRLGTAVTASGTPHTLGQWASLIDPTTRESYGIWIRILETQTGNTATTALLNIGYGPTGGGSEQIVLPNLMAGESNAGLACPRYYWFPVYIPAGVRVSAQIQSIVIGEVGNVSIWLEQYQHYPGLRGVVEAVGEVTASSRGTLVTPGTDAFGTWTSLGTVSQAKSLWTVAVDYGGDATAVDMTMMGELGIGPDSDNVTAIHRFTWIEDNNEIITTPFPSLAAAAIISGATIWARLGGAGVEARGVIAYGIG
jgi:hypothetical protein